MSNTPGPDAPMGETWWRETARMALERAGIAERERDEAIGLLREPYPDLGFSMHQWARRRDAFLARVDQREQT